MEGKQLPFQDEKPELYQLRHSPQGRCMLTVLCGTSGLRQCYNAGQLCASSGLWTRCALAVCRGGPTPLEAGPAPCSHSSTGTEEGEGSRRTASRLHRQG